MTVSFNKPVVCPVLIGRTPDLAALLKCMEQAQCGRGQVALLCGEAGIGKSRLVAEIKTSATRQGFQCLQGNCFSTDFSCPYAPLLDVLRSVFLHTTTAQLAIDVAPFVRELSPLFPEFTQLFPELATLPLLPSLDPEQEKRRLFAALTQYFLNRAATCPLLLIVEDLHWSDETSLEFLHYLARRCVTHPLLVLLTYRSDEVRSSLRHWLVQLDRQHLTQEVALTHLSRSDTDAMLRAIFDLQRPVPVETLDALYGLTEGNPFFIEEILKSLIATGGIFYAHGAWDRKPLGELHIPRSIQDAVQQRSDHLSASARQVLILAAVAGRRFDFAVLQQLTHHDEQQLLILMKELIAAQLVVEESADRFAFRHALTRQVVYAQLLVRERQTLHRSIAETMEHLYAGALEAHLGDLASQYYEASLWEKALEYAQRAGEKAQRLYAPRAAIEQLTWALSAANHLATPPPAKVYRARGQAYETLGEFEQARRDYEQALEVAHSAHDSIAEWQSMIDLGFLWAERDYQQTGVYFRRAIDLARALADPNLLAHSLNRLGNWHLNTGQPLEALRCHQEALSTFQEVHDQHGVAETLDLLGLAAFTNCDLVQSAAYYQQSVELFRETDNRHGLVSSLATLLLCSGNSSMLMAVPVVTSLADVVSQGETVLSLVREIGQRSGEAYTLFCMALCLDSRGEYARALEVAQQSLDTAKEIEHRQWMTGAHWTLGTLYLNLLSLPEARQHLEQALVLAQEIGSSYWIGMGSALLAEVSIQLKDLAHAESLLTTAFASTTLAPTQAQRLLWCAQAKLALAKGKPGDALDMIDQLISSVANVTNGQSIPHLSHVRGKALMLLHETAEAETALQAAQGGARIQGLRPLLWRISLDLGKLYQVQQRDEEAEYAFAAAQELIEELATPIPDTSLRNHFLHEATALIPRQEPLSPRRAAKKAFGGLTEREREVASLIAQGKANREIADILVVNYRTIEKHVENVLSKLGFVSRTQIAVWASEKGLGKKEES